MSRTAAPLQRTCGQRLLAVLLALLALQTLLFASAPAHAQSNNATFVSQNVPSTMVAGQTYDVWIIMKNTGESTWSAASNYKLGSQNPDNNTTWGKSSVALAAPVVPGEDAYFYFKVTAPYTPGNYNFQWSMGRYDYWFASSTANVVVNVTAPTGNNATFVTQSVPATMTAGQTYSVSVTMKNTGTSTWSAANNYKLGSQNPADNTTWGPSRATLAASVAPGAQYTFTYNITAPTTLGTHNFQWGMIREGTGWFGANTPNTAVNITASANQPTLSIQRTPTPLVAGQNHTLSWSSTKATSVTYTCTASGTGYTGSATLATSGSTTHATSAAWIGHPSTCTWRATGAGGSTTVTETMTTVAAPAAETVTYFHNDIAGTPQLATNASGALVWKENYLPYGQRQAQPPASAGNRLWYTGKPHEEDTGLTYMGARYYMPLVGRFTGMDPVDIVPEQPHSLNRYAYGNNNPYKYIDPNGKYAESVWDAFNIALGFNSLVDNIRAGNWSGAALDGVGLALDGAATAIPVIPAGAASGIKAYRAGEAAKTAAIGAESAANALRLNKALASEAQMAGAGTKMAGEGARVPFRDAQRIAAEHGGNPSDWAKMTSPSHTARDGVTFETHWVENVRTRQRVEFKTKFSGGE